MNGVVEIAAQHAGLPNIHLVHESEAAASLCLLKQTEKLHFASTRNHGSFT